MNNTKTLFLHYFWYFKYILPLHIMYFYLNAEILLEMEKFYKEVLVRIYSFLPSLCKTNPVFNCFNVSVS